MRYRCYNPAVCLDRARQLVDQRCDVSYAVEVMDDRQARLDLLTSDQCQRHERTVFCVDIGPINAADASPLGA